MVEIRVGFRCRVGLFVEGPHKVERERERKFHKCRVSSEIVLVFMTALLNMSVSSQHSLACLLALSLSDGPHILGMLLNENISAENRNQYHQGCDRHHFLSRTQSHCLSAIIYSLSSYLLSRLPLHSLPQRGRMTDPTTVVACARTR